jgi:hypothetical protein
MQGDADRLPFDVRGVRVLTYDDTARGRDHLKEQMGLNLRRFRYLDPLNEFIWRNRGEEPIDAVTAAGDWETTYAITEGGDQLGRISIWHNSKQREDVRATVILDTVAHPELKGARGQLNEFLKARMGHSRGVQGRKALRYRWHYKVDEIAPRELGQRILEIARFVKECCVEPAGA